MSDTSTFPHSREAEEAVIGSVLINPDCFKDVAGILSPGGSDFYIFRNRFVWEAFEALDEEGLPIDVITVPDRLDRAGKLEEVGGVAHLVGLLNQVPTTLNVEEYAMIVAEYSARRKLLVLASKQATMAIDTSKPVGTILAEIDRDLVGVSSLSGIKVSKTHTAADAVTAAMTASEAAAKGNGSAIPTGLVDLDRRLNGGLFPEDLVIIAARSGEGKTALMASVAANIAGMSRVDSLGNMRPATLRPKGVAFFTLEMSSTQIINRLVSQITGIPVGRLKNGKIEDGEWERYYEAAEMIARSPLFIDDTPVLGIPELRQKVRRLVDQGVEVVFIDQLNFLDAQMDNKSQEHVKLNWLAHRLKVIARELQICMVVAHQMNRGVESRPDDDPTLADLEQAGDKPASVVLFVRHRKSGEIFQNSWLYLAKNRDGAAGVRVPVVYLPERTRFESAASL